MPETVVHFQVRMSPDLHARLARRARDEKLSLNALVVGLLDGASTQHASGPESAELAASRPSA